MFKHNTGDTQSFRVQILTWNTRAEQRNNKQKCQIFQILLLSAQTYTQGLSGHVAQNIWTQEEGKENWIYG